MANMESLEELLQEELKDMYDAEKQLTKALPKLAKKATTPDLQDAFEEHLRQTEQHMERLEQVFDQLGMPVKGKTCKGMKNLIAEGNDMIADADDDATRDAIMIAAAQKVEHYEIAAYGTLRTWANVLGHREIASMLEDTLEEEKETDQKLTGIAEGFVNQAAAEDEEEEEPRKRTVGARASRRPAAADRNRTGRR
ncbi:MAG: ferritin-like domain-containing protein [Acidobacteria bacterium]|nr:MAG: ferritin-like domain-containing protein [Acidobacteriota bacterium]PYQ92134.1 MAG: ferritin-like domain-containing protein [Acidobacteriota bacterium]PYR12924.1 MAG: ferritin-like domain-containing protein [Acidobacteriota bacterium]